jgi:O-antigen/teichoic acid export membrane protein
MSVNKTTIAKNTLMLYLRMILVMAATLYTTRIVLKNLGVEDYGIYNVVAGIVSMFAFLNASMAGATQRFLSFELGINDEKRVNLVFCQSVIIHLIIAAVILVLAETIGLWFVYNKLTIPEERFDSAMWVYQIAILSFIFQVVNVPYHASIIAHEKMNVYAWVSIIDVALKLGIAFVISVSPIDKLITYSLLILMTTIVMFLFYRIYSKRHFKECKFHLLFDKSKFTEMFSFASWNIIGNMAYTLRVQGSNILLNMFFGPVVNAARGVAHQVDGAVEQFVTNFQTASNPQIVKSYAQEEYQETMRLVSQCSKFSFFLMILLGMPIMFQVDYILSIWLTNVPEYTAIFVQLILLNGIIDSLSKALKTHVKATGKVKWYMIIQGGFYLLALPVIWIFLKLGYSPVSSIVILVAFTFLGTFLRLILVRKVANGFSIRYFAQKALFPAIVIGSISIGIGFAFSTLSPTTTIVGLVVNTIAMLVLLLTAIWVLGINKSEKKYIVNLVRKVLKR